MMELRRCKFGHSYDPSISPDCPECAAMAGHTVPLVNVDMGYNAPGYADFGPAGGAGKTEPIQRDAAPMNPQGAAWANAEDYKSAGYSAESYNPTMPVNMSQDMAVRPVAGWLICVEGPEKGKDFRLHSDMNYIGRAKSNDVVISDPTVSRERHAMVAYDSRGKMFFFAPANGSSLVRQNGKPVLSTVELNAGDRLEIGEGIYMFVPLCGDNFEW